MKEWQVPVTWEMYGMVTVVAETLAEAMEIARDKEGVIPLPTGGSYVDESWRLSTDTEEEVELFQKQEDFIEMNKQHDFESYLMSRNDLIDNLSYQMAVTLCKTDETLSDEDVLPWDMEIIGAINEAVKHILTEHGIPSCWPYNEDEIPCYLTDSCCHKDCPFKNTELVNKSIEGILHLSTCSHCNLEFAMQQADYKDGEWYSTCPVCHKEYVYQIPHDSPILRFIFGYCRVRRIFQDKGYLSLGYCCDPDAEPGAPLDSMDSCMCCSREGCHLHTAAMDGEMLLNGEKDLETVDSFWKSQVDE